MARFSLAFLTVALCVLALGVQGKDKKHAWMKKKLSEKQDLLKEESNIIDHGPKYKTRDEHGMYKHHGSQKKLLLGHKGEHWAVDYERGTHVPKYPSKGRQQNDLDDIRLQDLEYQQQEASVTKEKKEKRRRWRQKNKQHRLNKKQRQQTKERKAEKVRSIRKEVKKAALKGLSPEKIYERFGGQREAKIARRFYKKWLAKYKASKGKKGKKVKKVHSSVP